jgi:hypothetical protein
MPSQYVLTEHAPTTSSYIRSGRGGAGNTFRTTSSSRPASVSTTAAAPVPAASSSSTRRFFSGVGGAGNAHQANERPLLSLDDEVRRMAAREEHAATMGHCGIGGAGNVYYRRKASDASDHSAKSVDDASSVSSVGSKKNLWMQVRNSLTRD